MKNSSSSGPARVLTSYLIKNALSPSTSTSGRGELLARIMSVFENGGLGICLECKSKAENLLKLHLDLERIQMEILNVLRNLQDYLVMQNFFRGGDIHSVLGEFGGFDGDAKEILVHFQNILQQKFIHRDLSDGTHVRLERLENCLSRTRVLRYGDTGRLTSKSTDAGGLKKRKKKKLKKGSRVAVGGELQPSVNVSDFNFEFEDNVDYVGNSVGVEEFHESDEDLNDLPLALRKKVRKKAKVTWLHFGDEKAEHADVEDDDEGGSTDDSWEPELAGESGVEASDEDKGYSDQYHGGQLQWDCDICLQNIPFKEMYAHLKTHPEFEKYYKCDVCPHVRWVRYFGTYKGLVWHYIRTAKGGHKAKLPCKLCSDSDESILYDKKELCKHLYDFHQLNHKKPQCKIDNCLEEFCDPASLRLHQQNKHPEEMGKVYTCETCQKTFLSEKAKYGHIYRDHNDNPFKCALCPKQYRTERKLREHEKSHEEGWKPKPQVKVLCPHCPKMISKNSLGYHIRDVHEEKSLCCVHCGKAFSNPQTLKKHEETHNPEKNYKCSECSYAGRTESHLKTHMESHGEKKFPCHLCPRTFATRKYLYDHVLRHTNEKNYKCSKCSYAGNTKARLRLHMKLHEEKKFQCSICPRAYHTNADLNHHIRSHSQEKTFECKTCGKLFRSIYGRNTHRWRKHRERPAEPQPELLVEVEMGIDTKDEVY